MDIIEKQFSLLAEKLNNLIYSGQGDSEEARYLIERVNEFGAALDKATSQIGWGLKKSESTPKPELSTQETRDVLFPHLKDQPSCQCAAIKERLDKKIEKREAKLRATLTSETLSDVDFKVALDVCTGSISRLTQLRADLFGEDE